MFLIFSEIYQRRSATNVGSKWLNKQIVMGILATIVIIQQNNK